MARPALIRPASVGGSDLTRRYLQETSGVARFFAGSPFRLEHFRQKASELERRFDRDKREIAARSLRPASQRAEERLRRFVDEGGIMVTTGQQAGFLTGPLYTVYKALSAVRLAEYLENSLGKLVLPVFWVASEDHDWEEANHTFLLDRKNRLHRVGLEGEERRPTPMSEWQIGDISSILDEAAQIVGTNAKSAEWVERILGPYRRPEATVASAFADAMTAILQPFDALIADAADPTLKEASRPVLRDALTDSDRHERALEARTEALDEAGFKGQVSVLEGGTNVFHHGEHGRERLYRRNGEFRIRSKRWKQAEEEVLAVLDESPAEFSPNVLLRPVVESWVYPTVAYVGGPGEIAYFAQVTALFEEYGIRPPIVVPRFSGTVVEPKTEGLLEELGLDLEAVGSPKFEILESLAQKEIPESVAASLAEIREQTTAMYENLLNASEELDDPTLTRSLGSARNRALREARRAERKIVRAIKRSDRLEEDKLDRVLDSLRPVGSAQDRAMNILPFLARYGEYFLREAKRAIDESWRLPAAGD